VSYRPRVCDRCETLDILETDVRHSSHCTSAALRRCVRVSPRPVAEARDPKQRSRRACGSLTDPHGNVEQVIEVEEEGGKE